MCNYFVWFRYRKIQTVASPSRLWECGTI
jgi:hypothetical protein